MVGFLENALDSYNHYVFELTDQRTVSWPLLGSPIPVILIIIGYLWFVLKAGPAFMKNRQPYNLDTTIQIYNVIQVILCTKCWMYGLIYLYGPTGRYSLFCEPIDYEVNDFTISTLKNFYLYFLLKIVDLLDTIFFVLRKKQSQVTFLHVYHHTIMVALIWYGLRYLPAGHESYLAVINSFVHTVMYSYYFLSNYDKEYQKKLWWKKYITQLQMFQFASIIIHSSFALHPSCTFPKYVIFLVIPQNLFILMMFWDFYKKTYLRPKAVKGH